MVQDQKHRSLLLFIRKIVEVPLGYSKDDLLAFRNVASREYSTLVPLIDEYIRAGGKGRYKRIARNGYEFQDSIKANAYKCGADALVRSSQRQETFPLKFRPLGVRRPDHTRHDHTNSLGENVEGRDRSQNYRVRGNTRHQNQTST